MNIRTEGSLNYQAIPKPEYYFGGALPQTPNTFLPLESKKAPIAWIGAFVIVFFEISYSDYFSHELFSW